jgi:PhoPQ-activated pathogenicity-related protein
MRKDTYEMRLMMPLSLLVLLLIVASTAVAETALDRYVAKPDPAYSYSHYKTDDDFAYKTYFLSMTSQEWRSPVEVHRSLWQHDITITVPQILHSDSPRTAVMLINGGSNKDRPPTTTNELEAAAALYLGTVVVKVSQIPNQPLYFTDELDRRRTEDEIIAYSFDKFLDTGDEEWPLLLPMTKAAVRAMDTVQDFMINKGKRIDDFVVIGGSKRGWTTWLTAAVDRRVKAIGPASIDLLNIQSQFTHHYEALGFYTPAIEDYVAFDLPCRVNDRRGEALLAAVDPYRYLDRMTMPKFVANSAGDQFFVSDSSRFYYADLPEPKRLRYAPNTDHKQSEEALINLLSWIDDINDGKTPPRYSWTVQPNGVIRVTAQTKPKEVRLWKATNPDARDFRLEKIGPAWTSVKLSDGGGRTYLGYAPPPPRGWTAYMVELTYETAGELAPDETFTTEVVITPNTLPFEGRACDVCRNGLCQPPSSWRRVLNGP